MSIIKSENWDSVSAPALPSGWTVDTELVTATTNSPTSAPNSLVYPVASAVGNVPHATWATQDTNSGNVRVSATVRFAATAGEQDCWIFARASAVASNANNGTVSYYMADLSRNAGDGLYLQKRASGATTTLGHVGAGVLAAATNYRLSLLCNGAQIQATCQRLSDGFWLNSSGVFVSDPTGHTVAISVTDSAIAAAAGYSGCAFYLSGAAADIGVDDWLLETPTSPPVTYYVAPGGSNTNSGLDAAHPWQTIAKVNGTALNPGDQVLFLGGQTFAGNLVVQDSGTAALPILISSYGAGAAIITPGTGTGLQIKDASYVRATNLAVVGPGVSVSGSTSSTTSAAAGVEVISTATQASVAAWRQSIYLDGLSVTGCYNGIDCHSYGGSAAGPYPVGFSDLRISACTVSECLGYGLHVWANSAASPDYTGLENGTGNVPYHKNVYIGGCTVQHIYGSSAHALPEGQLTGSGIVVANVNGGTTERCSVAACGQATPGTGGGPVGNWCYACTNYTVQYCESSACHHPLGLDGGGFDLDGGCVGCVMQYCYSHECDGPGFQIGTYPGSGPTTNNVLRYSISQNDGRGRAPAAYRWFGAPGSTVIHNCTFYAASAGAWSTPCLIQQADITTDQSFYNNIFWCGGGLPLFVAGLNGATFAGNLYWFAGNPFSLNYGGTTYASLAAWQAAQESAGGVPRGVFADPLLAAGGAGGTLLPAQPVAALVAYGLSPSSPAIDAGLDLRALFALDPGLLDLQGLPNRAGAGYDIGATEYGAAALIGASSGVRRVSLAGGIGG